MADFQWIFPPGPAGASSSFTAQNATSPNDVFGTFPVHVGDRINLAWNYTKKSNQLAPGVQYECGISRNGTRSPNGAGQAVGRNTPVLWEFAFLHGPSLNRSRPAEDICVFLSVDSENQLYYLSTAFTILDTPRQDKPYLYTLDKPAGSSYTAPAYAPPQNRDHYKLATILGSVLGTFFLLGVVVASVLWWRRRAAGKNRLGKVIDREEGTELQRVPVGKTASVTDTPPPAYEERPRDTVEPVGGAKSTQISRD
ncbi:hypothetical protein BCR34DRAFT_667028 [Clohesyomyces aquaticus]|uniref:Uncharacterized protein n=1 Tax=Clohesyomyces aquaticus TaxID=1231657 RepID=A0A1Y1Z2Y3_9PLEO|nr:hypothetical protein BCR34DRAFT_667028 [Clohesyomyces aquaticus]